MENTEYQEYEILYRTKRKKQGNNLGMVEYDPSSNKPFMVYLLNHKTLEYELFSGEDDLETAIDVCDSHI